MSLEQLAEQIHKIYCKYKKEVHNEEYWTKGDYSKLPEEAKEADRYMARFIMEHTQRLKEEVERLKRSRYADPESELSTLRLRVVKLEQILRNIKKHGPVEVLENYDVFTPIDEALSDTSSQDVEAVKREKLSGLYDYLKKYDVPDKYHKIINDKFWELFDARHNKRKVWVMTQVHVFRAEQQPATKYYDPNFKEGGYFTNPPLKRFTCRTCGRERIARNLIVQVYYDGTYFFCAKGKGCKSPKAKSWFCTRHQRWHKPTTRYWSCRERKVR